MKDGWGNISYLLLRCSVCSPNGVKDGWGNIISVGGIMLSYLLLLCSVCSPNGVKDGWGNISHLLLLCSVCSPNGVKDGWGNITSVASLKNDVRHLGGPGSARYGRNSFKAWKKLFSVRLHGFGNICVLVSEMLSPCLGAA